MKQKKLNVLIGFEESQTSCIAFRKLGHNAYSNDLKPAKKNKDWHLKMDFFKALKKKKWDLIILHPPCTATAVCGNKWYRNTEERKAGIELCKAAWIEACKVCNHVALEQPKTIMQKYIGKKSQIIQPYQFGHGEQKETWLWLKGLPKLKPTKIVKERAQKMWKMADSKGRQERRSKTYSGIATAWAKQWTATREQEIRTYTQLNLF